MLFSFDNKSLSKYDFLEFLVFLLRYYLAFEFDFSVYMINEAWETPLNKDLSPLGIISAGSP